MDPSSQFKHVVNGQVFGSSKEVTSAIKQSFLRDLRGCSSTGGGGYSKIFRCAGRKYDAKRKKEVGCLARVRATKSRRKNLEMWKITEARNVHNNCTGEQENASLSAVDEMIATLVRATPSITGPAIAKMLKDGSGISVHPRTALRAKAKALGRTGSGSTEGFTVLTSLLEQLDASDNTVKTEWDANNRFARCFVMPGGAAKVAAKSPNKAFCLDGAHLRGSWNGVILTITTTDANNSINLCAFAVVREENAKSYEYLLGKAMGSKRMKKFLNATATTCFTDNDKGADAAMNKLAPLTEVRHCLEHILRSCRIWAKHGKAHAYKAAKSSTEPEFLACMERLYDISPTAHDKLDAIPHERWAYYAGRQNVCWLQVNSNPAESMNKTLLELRGKPIFDLVHGCIMLIAKRLFDASELKKDDESQAHTPFATAQFDEASRTSRKHNASPLGGGKWFVTDTKTGATHGHKVSIKWTSGQSRGPPEMDCTCGVPKKMQLPCSHLLAVAKAQKKTKRTLSLINKNFEMQTYRDLASAHPVDLPAWSSLEKDSSKKGPKMVKRPRAKAPTPTRRILKRIRSKGEEPARRKKRTRTRK
ncbi:unnamed protein product [Ectocarpus sp. CCAP 1310/34]|nr:unnamed protein product [Ectocarpus sp. CCAP 1310/34]